LPVTAEVAAEAARRLAAGSAEQAREALLTLVERDDEALTPRWLGLHWLLAEFGPLHADFDRGRLALQLELRP
ncbi:MAG: hypothetical protein KDI51_15455, partial [Xanthomonadales bacterium]|nr:hypothetical protein [Xanthomonadales bacterium]